MDVVAEEGHVGHDVVFEDLLEDAATEGREEEGVDAGAAISCQKCKESERGGL